MDLIRWAANARQGERITYHRGALGTLPGASAESGNAASVQGLVFLAHRPLGDGHYAYEATRISDRTARVLRAYQEVLRPRDRRIAA